MIIYKITNLINGKCYIGQTTGTLEARWRKHCRSDSKCTAIHNAIVKYGADNFSIEQIDSATTQSELNEKEAFWITELNTMSPNGYNLQNGGLREQLSDESCARISQTLKDKYTRHEVKISWKRKVCQYDKSGKLIQVWSSIVEAAKTLGIEDKHIPDACSGKRRSVGGFMWRYYEDTHGESIEFPARRKNPDHWFKSHQREIDQFDKAGNLIKRWSSVSEASKALGVSTGQLCETCQGKHKIAKGYIWKYADKETG